MRRIGTVIALLLPLCGMPAWAQGSRHDDIVVGAAGHALAAATVTVCVATATGIPCSPLAQLYMDDTLSVAAPNPLQTDGLGNYHFYAAPGRYQIQFSGTGVQGSVTMPDVILPNDPSSPTFSSVSTSGAISARALSLGGNLSVSGNAAVSGALTVDGGPVPSTAVADTWTAPQSFANGPYFTSGSPWFDVKGFCASGSQQQTTGTITGGSSALTLASAIDFTACPSGSGQPGEGITIYHAGGAPTIAAPIGVTVTPVGGSATTAYGYELVANDYAGGVTAPTAAATISNGEPVGSLSASIYNNVCFTTSTGAESYTLYRSVSSGAYAYVATFWDSTPPSPSFCYHDTNYNANGQAWGTGTTAIPDWGASTPPASALNDWCQTTIASGAGTASLTLAASCPRKATGAIVKHDDTPAVQAAVSACNTAAGGKVVFPISGNFTFGNIVWPDTRTVARGWIILDIEGQITITYPLTFGSPGGTGYGQSKIRITGGTGGSANSSQFPYSNTARINSGFVSPVIHTVYQNATSLYPFVFDHIGIYNRGMGGGDGIVNDGGNSGGLYISNVDVATTGTSLKIGFGGIGGVGSGPCTSGGGFGAYVDHSTFTAYFNGDPLTDCDGWTIDLNFGLSYLDHISLIGQGLHTMGMGTTDWSYIYEESGSTTGFLTWDTSNGACTPQCGSNSFRHVELSDPLGSADQYFVQTVNGGSSPPIGTLYIDSVEQVSGTGPLISGTTPFSACEIHQNGPIPANLIPGNCVYAAGIINGNWAAWGGGSGANMTANMTSGSGLNPFYSLNLGIPTGGGGALAFEGLPGNTADYVDWFDPSSSISSHTIQASIDANWVAHFYGFQQNSSSTKPNSLVTQLTSTGLIGTTAISNYFGPSSAFVGGTTVDISASGRNSSLGLEVSGSGDPLFVYDTSGALQTYIDASGAFHTAKAITSTLATGTAPITVTSTTPVANLTAQYAQSTQLTGTTTGVGGSSLSAGQCTSGTVTVTGATPSMSSAVSPATDPGTGFVWEGFVSAANTVTVRVCNVSGSTATPTASAYNVRVIQ